MTVAVVKPVTCLDRQSTDSFILVITNLNERPGISKLNVGNYRITKFLISTIIWLIINEVGSWKLEVESLFPSALAMSFIRVKLLVKDLRVTPVTLGQVNNLQRLETIYIKESVGLETGLDETGRHKLCKVSFTFSLLVMELCG